MLILKSPGCNLPSTTEFNRFEGVERIADLDNFIHEQYSYVYPDNLIKEISIVKDIVNRFIKNKDAVVIFSDHGFTAFANTKFNGRKILGVNFAEREGRYAEVTNDGDIVRNDDFFVYVSDEQKGILFLPSISSLPRRLSEKFMVVQHLKKC